MNNPRNSNREHSNLKAVKSRNKAQIDSIFAAIAKNHSNGKQMKVSSNANLDDELAESTETAITFNPDASDPSNSYLQYISYYYDDYDMAYHATFMNVVKLQCQFSMRGNLVTVYVPFEFWYKGGSAGSAKVPNNITPSGTSHMNVIGPKTGDLSLGYFYWSIFNNISNDLNPVEGTVNALMNETRTVLLSEETGYKIVGGIEGSGINVGTTMSDGFTVSSKYYSNSSYEMAGHYTINCLPWFYEPIRVGHLGGICAGIQRN